MSVPASAIPWPDVHGARQANRAGQQWPTHRARRRNKRRRKVRKAHRAN